MECKVSVLLNICRQNITSLSVLAGTTVEDYSPGLSSITCLFVFQRNLKTLKNAVYLLHILGVVALRNNHLLSLLL